MHKDDSVAVRAENLLQSKEGSVLELWLFRSQRSKRPRNEKKKRRKERKKKPVRSARDVRDGEQERC